MKTSELQDPRLEFHSHESHYILAYRCASALTTEELDSKIHALRGTNPHAVADTNEAVSYAAFVAFNDYRSSQLPRVFISPYRLLEPKA